MRRAQAGAVLALVEKALEEEGFPEAGEQGEEGAGRVGLGGARVANPLALRGFWARLNGGPSRPGVEPARLKFAERVLDLCGGRGSAGAGPRFVLAFEGSLNPCP